MMMPLSCVLPGKTTSAPGASSVPCHAEVRADLHVLRVGEVPQQAAAQLLEVRVRLGVAELHVARAVPEGDAGRRLRGRRVLGAA